MQPKSEVCPQEFSAHEKLIVLFLEIHMSLFPFFKAIEKSVVSWVNDSDVPLCPDCGNKFNIRNRRHHCRLCGSIMCRKCMEFVPLPLARKYNVKKTF